MNERAHTQYQTDDPRACQLVGDLLDQGYTPDDVRAVIDKKTLEWFPDYNMRGYLRPSTLFGPKFSEYLNAPEPKQAEEQRNQEAARQILQDKKKRLEYEIAEIHGEVQRADCIDARIMAQMDRLAIKEDQLEKINERLEAMG